MSSTAATTFIIAALGLAGVATLALVPPPAQLPPDIPPVLLLLQPALLVLGAAAIGGALAQKIGLGAPLFEAALRGRLQNAEIGRTIAMALLTGAAGSIVLVLYARMTPDLGLETPLATHVLYGGISEEVIARWGVMVLAAWALGKARVHQDAAIWAGLVIAAGLFAAGHLPALFLLTGGAPSPLLLAWVIGANTALGIAYGVLFWRRGLEAAMLAHAATHIFAAAARALT